MLKELFSTLGEDLSMHFFEFELLLELLTSLFDLNRLFRDEFSLKLELLLSNELF
jgi:hypothetical protein